MDQSRAEALQDFLVIGGGIAGISVAARLALLGSVTVLEAESALGYHTSGRSAAMFEEMYGLPSTVALNRASKDYLATENQGVLSPRGLLLIGTADTKSAFADDMKSMHLTPLSFDEARKIVPILRPKLVTELGYHDAAFDIDTDRLMQNFARETKLRGGEILMDSKVTAIEKHKTGWRVSTGSQDYYVRVLVNAAGAWVDQIATLAGITPIGFTPLRRSVARIDAPDGIEVKNWPMMFGPGETWYAKPDAGKLLVSPADEVPVEPHDAWPEDINLATGIARFENVTTHKVTRIQSSWAGLRTFSPDRSLVLGPDENDPAFVWVSGQGGFGFQTSPAASQLVADLVSGRQSNLDLDAVNALSPARFG